jgi:hypothetical protein
MDWSPRLQLRHGSSGKRLLLAFLLALILTAGTSKNSAAILKAQPKLAYLVGSNSSFKTANSEVNMLQPYASGCD